MDQRNDFSAYLAWLREHDVPVAVARDLQRDPDHDGPLIAGDAVERQFSVPGLPPFAEARRPQAHIAGDHATDAVLRQLARVGRFRSTSRVWDIGCGTGLFAVAAATMGAGTIIGVDSDPVALECAQATAAAAGVELETRRGSLLAPFAPDETCDFCFANLPHKPQPEDEPLPATQAGGGADGTALHEALVAGLAPRLASGARVLFFLHSLPHPRLLRAWTAHCDLQLLSWKRRYLQPGEYGALDEHFWERAAAGTSFVAGTRERGWLIAGVWSGVWR